MSVDPMAAVELVSWLLVPWHFALVWAVLAAAFVLDVVAVVLISRRVARAIRMQAPALGAVAVTVALRTGTPPLSWVQRARPVAADYRLTPAAPRPRPVAVPSTPPVRPEPPAPAAAPATTAGAARLVRPARPITVEAAGFATSANNVIADAIATCRRSAGGETR